MRRAGLAADEREADGTGRAIPAGRAEPQAAPSTSTPAHRRTYSAGGRRLVAGGGRRWSIRSRADVVDVGCGGGPTPGLARPRRRHGHRRRLQRPDPRRGTGESRRPARSRVPPRRRAATGLPDACADIVFERALIHHVPICPPSRTRRPACPTGRVLLVQDRTPRTSPVRGRSRIPGAGCSSLPPAARRRERPAGHRRRRSPRPGARPGSRRLGDVALGGRRRYADREDYLAEIGARTGRSILHELTTPSSAR